MRRLAPILCLAAGLVAASGSTARAQDNPLIEQGQTQYDELRFEEALQTLSAALVRPGNSEQERATIYRLLAFTYLALGRDQEANGAYRRLLAIDPDFEPGADVSPRFREFFAGVHEQWEAEGRPGTAPPARVEIEHESPARAKRGEPIELSATLQDPGGRVSAMVLAYRKGDEGVFERADAQPKDGGWVASIPAEAVTPQFVEYYFEAVDDKGLPVASRGDVAAPLRVTVPGPDEGGIASQWWFWTAIAAVAVGGAVTAGVLLSGDGGGGGQQPGSFIIIAE